MQLSRSAPVSLLALVLLCVGPAVPASAQKPARTVQDTVALSADGSLSIDNHEGSITVTTWDRSRVRYKARIMPTEDDPKAKKVNIQTKTDGNQLRIATVHEEDDDESVEFGFTEDGFQWGGTNIPAVHYTITMPRSAALTIDDHESTIEVTGHAGRLRIDSHEGQISVAKQRGPLFIDTHESPISVTDQTGDVTINTHEGRMELRRVVGRVRVDTHDGKLTIDKLEGGLRFEAHDGSANVSFARLTDGVIADTHGGDVTLTLPTDAGFTLRTDVDDGANVRSDFDLSTIRVRDNDEDSVNYRGAINGGGPIISIESNDGDFVLRSR